VRELASRGRSSRLWVRFGRYSIGSVIALASSELVFVVCFGTLGLGPTGSSVAAFVAGAIPNYVINRYWAWGRRGRLRVAREVVLYIAIIVASLVISIIATSWADDLVKTLTRSHSARTTLVSGAYLGTQAVLFLVKFALFQTVIFTEPRAPAADSPASPEPPGRPQ